MNAAHSGSWIVLAIGKSSVGIDVEEVKTDFPFAEVIPFNFSDREQLYLGTGEQARRRFYELWTRKEAFVKAIAIGVDATFPQVPSLPGFHQLAPATLGTVCPSRG